MNDKDTIDLPIYIDQTCRWSIVCGVSVQSVTAGFETVLDVTELLFNSLASIVTPTTLKYNVQTYPPESPITYPAGDSPGQHQQEVLTRTVSDADGVTYAQFESSLPAVDAADRHIQRIDIESATTWVRSGGEDVPANRSQNTQLYHLSDQISRDHIYDPVRFNVEFVRNYDEEEVDEYMLLYITIWTKTDLWFQDSPVGRENAQRLSDCLTSVVNTLDPVRIVRESNRYSSEDLARIL